MADVRMQMVVSVARNGKKKRGVLKRIFMVMSKNIFSMVTYYK